MKEEDITQLCLLECSLLKVEPWNSIKVTFSIPKKAAKQLKELARSNSALLKDLDILTVQVEGKWCNIYVPRKQVMIITYINVTAQQKD